MDTPLSAKQGAPPSPPANAAGPPAGAGRLGELRAYLAAEKQTRERRSRRVKAVSGLLFYSALAFIILVALIYSADKKGARSFLGYSYYTVLTDSMQGELPRGSLIIVKNTDESRIQAGDDITFMVDADTVLTHRVVEVLNDYEQSGMRAFVTQGTENPLPDKEVVYAANVVGVVLAAIPELGMVLSYIRENLWLVLVFWMLFIAFSLSLNIFLGEKKQRKHRRRSIR